MAKGKRTGKSIKSYYKNYANALKWNENAEETLKRHIKKQPNDNTAKQALKRLNSGAKKYTRDRKSDGHICKSAPSIALRLARSDDRLTIIDQLVNMGYKYRGRNKTTTRKGKRRVR